MAPQSNNEDFPVSQQPDPVGRKSAKRTQGLTDQMIRTAKPPVTGRIVLRDSGRFTGLELRITSNGVKSFSYTYRRTGDRKRMRYTLGRYGEGAGEWTLEAARKAMRKGVGRVADNADPQGEKMALRQGKTVNELFADCHADIWSTTAWGKRAKQLYDRHIGSATVGGGIKVGSMKVRDLHRSHANEILDKARKVASQRTYRGSKASGNTTRNRVLSVISAMLNFGVGKGWYGIEFSVARSIGRLSEEKRENYVKVNRLGQFWHATAGLDDIDQKQAMQLVVLTAQRTKQIRHLRWEWIDWTEEAPVIEFPGRIMKSGRKHVLGLAPMALSILKKRHKQVGAPAAGPVFPNADTAERVISYSVLYDVHVALCKKLGLVVADVDDPEKVYPTVGLHDWRRSFSNSAKARKVNKFDRARVLAHADNSITEEHYTDDDGYPDETRAALGVWENVIYVAAAGNKVVQHPAVTAS
jgi:integrase